MDRSLIKKTFLDNYFKSSYKINSIPGDCSPRTYDRIFHKGNHFILMNAPIDLINLDPFIKIDNFLRDNDFLAPKIYQIDQKNGFLLSEDFGNNSFNHILSKYHGNDLIINESNIYKYATDLLIKLHKINLDHIDLPEYNNDLLLQELQIFIDYYLKLIKKHNLSYLETEDFKNIWLEIFDNLSDNRFLVLRDYHADNLFFLDNNKDHKKIGLIDFQDAVLGSRAYDMVSFLQDARRDVSKDIQKNMIDYYIKESNIDDQQFIMDYNILSLQRNIKILGVFARQGLEYNNIKYLNLIDRVMEYILPILDQKNIFNNLKLFLKWQ
ncbi:phosphotransferase [Rickettsiales bacterium]|nr:phosphotransferase [Rickettsiales bacterium]